MKITKNIYILLLFLSICFNQTSLNISFFDFNERLLDNKNEQSVDIAEQLNIDFINIMKDDMSRMPGFNFIPSSELDKELNKVNEKLLAEIKKDLEEEIINIIPRSRFNNIIEIISNNFSTSQLNSITDSLIFSISVVTKDITKEMFLSNTKEEGGVTEITISDLYNFINNVTEESINKSTYTSLIAASKEDFKTDFVVRSRYIIDNNKLTVYLSIYNYSDFTLFREISSTASINRIHVLIKDLEFKLLSSLGTSLSDEDKMNLCMYDINKFSKKYHSLYFSNVLSTEDIKELALRFHIKDSEKLINKYYNSIFNDLSDKNYNYSIKLYKDDNFYQIYSIENVSESSFSGNVLRSNWSNQIGISNNIKSSQKTPKIIADIDFDVIQAIQFKKEQDNFVSFLKQISIYSLIVATGVVMLGIL